MKTSILKTVVLILVSIFTFSCTSDDSSSSTETGGTSITTSNTWVKLTAVSTTGITKPNYKILMFSSPPSTTAPLPPILKEATTDANGLAFFDLNAMITSTTPTTYYFEAFTETSTGYTWRSISHYNVSLHKGTMATSSIIVN